MVVNPVWVRSDGWTALAAVLMSERSTFEFSRHVEQVADNKKTQCNKIVGPARISCMHVTLFACIRLMFGRAVMLFVLLVVCLCQPKRCALIRGTVFRYEDKYLLVEARCHAVMSSLWSPLCLLLFRA